MCERACEMGVDRSERSQVTNAVKIIHSLEGYL